MTPEQTEFSRLANFLYAMEWLAIASWLGIALQDFWCYM